MRQISDCLPAWLIDEMAARGHDGAHTLTAAATNAPRKKAGADAPASADTGRNPARPGVGGRKGRPVLTLVMGGRGMSTATRRQLGVPAPAVLRPTLLVIEGGHATGPR
jgi:hypothetical protein